MDDSNSKITVIQSRLPYTDRRALSEAWFSALHLASDGPRCSVPERRGVAIQPVADVAVTNEKPNSGAPVAQYGPNARPAPERPPVPAVPLERSTAVLPPRREPIAKHRSRPSADYPPFRTSLAIGFARGRVQLLLRREGATLHVVAVCRPEAAGVVRRALALADAHLRLRGEAVRASVRLVDGAEART